MYLKVAELEEANSQLSKQLRETKAGAPQETKQAGVATSAYALEAAQKVTFSSLPKQSVLRLERFSHTTRRIVFTNDYTAEPAFS